VPICAFRCVALRRSAWFVPALLAVSSMAIASPAGPKRAASPRLADLRVGPNGLIVLVLDPLALQNACPCVKGYAQRDYDALGLYLKKRLHRRVGIAFGASLKASIAALPRMPDLIVAKQSVVEAYGSERKAKLDRIAMLTGADGRTTQQGLFIVRSDDPAKRLADLKGRKILYGPKDESEKSAAALTAMLHTNLEAPEEIETRPNCNIAALAVVDREADAAIISGYALPLLSGCGTVRKGDLKVIGKTAPVPFVAVYVSDRVTPDLRRDLRRTLLAVRTDKALKSKMESRDGFVDPPR
jgi:ABC-type phosphate/phosphonate transport system substrate-binding protein